MGVTTYVYLGPYVECHQRPMTIEISYSACSNTGCANHSTSIDSPFCPQCGCVARKLTRKVSHFRSAYGVVGDDLIDVASEGDERDILYLVPNHNKPTRFMFFTSDESVHMEVCDRNVNENIAWFNERYSKQIALLRDAFDHVEVKWGLHQHAR